MENKLMALMAFTMIAVFLLSIIPVSAFDGKSKWQATISLPEKVRERAKQFLENKEQTIKSVRECQKNVTAENCSQVLDNAKDALKLVMEKVSTHFENIKERVEKSKKLTEEEKQAVIAAIEEREEKLNDLLTRVENASSFAELKEIAKELRSLVRVTTFRAVDLIRERKLGVIIERAEKLEIKLNRTLERMQEKGYDISELQGLVSQFNEKIGNANASYMESRTLWQKFFEMVANHTTEGRAEIVQQAHDKMKEAHNYLKEAHSILKQIIQEFRELKAEKELEPETEKNETAENEANISS